MPADLPPLSPPTLGADGRILEGIVATLNVDGSVNVSPMGPIVDDALDRLWLRPFKTSTTYRNLKRTGRGVFHVTDDVELLAQAAVGQPDPHPRFVATPGGDALILANACRWYALEIESLDDAEERTSIVARVADRGAPREFFGFNRAKHAVLEAAILATRIHLTGPSAILTEYDRLQIAVDKTGAAAERRAMAFLRAHIARAAEQAGQQQ
ncbi:MAG: DUF447 family protein [Planctomycetaceae bacterium]|nr:DUF447 family protein [Planctomycetaceae bacterium]